MAFLTLYPFWYILVGSLNDGMDYMKGGVYFWPREFTIMSYQTVFGYADIVDAYLVTIARTILGTASHLIFTGIFAYAFKKRDLAFKGVYATICIIPMFFGGGLIPYYMLIRQIHLYDNFLVYIIPGLFSFYNVLIFQAFFREIPDSIVESAKIDGAGEYRIFFSLILPISKPVFAALALFTAVGHWNSYYDSLLFTQSNALQTVQLFLMRIIRSKDFAATLSVQIPTVGIEARKPSSTTIQYATMICTALPIIVIYPFLQKYFTKGLLIGAVKG
jgi:putative aldouronate transport system permease protein